MFHLQVAHRQRQHGRAQGRAQQPPHVGHGNGAGRFNHQQHNAARQQQQHHHDLIGHGGVGDGFLNNNLLPPFAVRNNHQQHVVAAPDLNVGQGWNHPAAPPAGGDGLLNNQHHPVQADQPRLAQNANIAAVHQHHGDWLHENNPQPRQAQAAPPLQGLQDDLAQNANIAAGNQQNGDGLHHLLVIPVSLLPLRNLRDSDAQEFFELLGENMALPHETFQNEEEAEQGVPITSAVAGKRVLVTVLRRLRALMRSHVRSNPLVRGSITDLGINLPPTMNPVDFLKDNNAISTIAEELLGELSPRHAFTRFVQAWAVSVILPFSERNGDNTLQTSMRNLFLRAVAEECGLEAGSVRFDLEDNRAENVINQFFRKHVITSVIRNLPGRKDSIAEKHRYWLPMVPRFFGDVGFNFRAFRITDSLPRELPETSYVDIHVPFLQFLGFNALEPFHVHIISDAGSNLWNVLSLPPPARPPAQARQAPPAAPMDPPAAAAPMARQAPAAPEPQEAPMRIVLANIAGGDGDNTTLTNTNSWQPEGSQAHDDETSMMLSQRGQVSMSRSNGFTSTSSSSESSVSKMSVDDDTALEEVGEISKDEAPPPKDDQELPNADNLSLSDAEDGLGLVAGKQDENVNAFSSDKEIVRTIETEALQQGDTDPPCSDDDEEEEPGENRAKKRNYRGRGDGGTASKVRKVEIVVSLSICSPAHQLVSFLAWSLTPLFNLF